MSLFLCDWFLGANTTVMVVVVVVVVVDTTLASSRLIASLVTVMRNVRVHGARLIYLESLLIHTEHCGQQDTPNIHTTTLIFRVFVRSEGELCEVSTSVAGLFQENTANIFPIDQECV